MSWATVGAGWAALQDGRCAQIVQALLFGRRERFPDAGPDRADPLRAVEGRDDGEIVGQARRHPVARPHAQRPQRTRGPVGLFVEFGVGPRAGSGDQCGGVRPRVAKHMGDRADAGESVHRS